MNFYQVGWNTDRSRSWGVSHEKRSELLYRCIDDKNEEPMQSCAHTHHRTKRSKKMVVGREITNEMLHE